VTGYRLVKKVGTPWSYQLHEHRDMNLNTAASGVMSGGTHASLTCRVRSFLPLVHTARHDAVSTAAPNKMECHNSGHLY
jgi:hypothetical protein